MFFDGDLRSGITASMQQGKVVACFVTDDGEESKLWEDEFLKEPELNNLLETKAITLRLVAGSQEAGYLGEIYPLPKTPTLVIILQGTLKAYLVSGIEKEEFLKRAKEALAPFAEDSSSGAAPAATESPVLAAQPPAVASMMEERRRRMEAQKKEHDAKVKADRAAAHAARQADLDPSAPPDPKKEADRKYAAEQKQRQKAAKEAKERVLKQIEDDKKGRKEKEALRKEQARATAMMDDAVNAGSSGSSSPFRQPAAKRSAECALQVRLFDGSTIRSRFPSNQTLREHVRKWVDEQRGDDDTPYTFKQILSPLPNKTVGESEEEESLQDIGFCPSATLVLLEVRDFTPAYQGGVSTILRTGFPAAIGLLSSGVGMVTGALGSFLGGRPATEIRQVPVASTSTTERRNPAEDRQFYNGNSLAFEPRKDDDKKQD